MQPSKKTSGFFGKIKNSILKSLRTHDIYVTRSLPKGVDAATDIRRELPNQTFSVIFDVGANIGGATAAFLEAYRTAHIWCFEPGESLHERLIATFAGNPRVTCEKLALGSKDEIHPLSHTSRPTMFHLTRVSPGLPDGVFITGEENVSVTTLDHYCDSHHIDKIDFLKIDTEGHDLQVLIGAEKIFSEGRVACVQCECTVNPDNKFHCAMEAIKSHLEMRGYRLFGIYNPVSEKMSGGVNLRRVDAVFISPEVMRKNRPGLPAA